MCHGDIHTANVLVEPNADLHLIDCDDCLLAPKERDLLFLLAAGMAGASTRPSVEAHFFRGYGDKTIDPDIMTYYRLEWPVTDMAEVGRMVIAGTEVGYETKELNLRGFLSLFDRGSSVEMAIKTERSSGLF